MFAIHICVFSSTSLNAPPLEQRKLVTIESYSEDEVKLDFI